MPASERLFGDPLPALLYPDTDFLIAVFFDTQQYHQRALGLLERLVRERSTTLVLSSLIWAEFAHTLSRRNFRAALPDALAQEVAEQRWTLPETRERYLRRHIERLDRVLAQFAWIEAPLDATVRRSVVDLMARHALGSQDAVHVATAFAAGARDLVSFDATYRRVDGLALWNDGVHARA